MKIAFITGTTRGLGKALSGVYTRKGWDVMPLSRPGFDLLTPDISRITSGADEAVFINNAASVLVLPRFDDQQIIEELTKNLISPIRLMQRFIETYPSGTLINITSGLANDSLPYFDLYCTAKSGMEAYIRSLQCKGIRCFNFDPGVIDTDMQAMLRSKNHPARQQFVDYYNNGLLSEPSKVAARLYAEHHEVLTP